MSKDYKKRLNELDKETERKEIDPYRPYLTEGEKILFDVSVEAISIAREILKERDALLKEKPCEGCGKKEGVRFKVCSECFYSGGY